MVDISSSKVTFAMHSVCVPEHRFDKIVLRPATISPEIYNLLNMVDKCEFAAKPITSAMSTRGVEDGLLPVMHFFGATRKL